MNPTDLFFLSASLFSHFVLSAQSDTTYYYSKEGKLCSQVEAHYYKRVKLVDREQEIYAVEQYSIDSTLQCTGFTDKYFNWETGFYTEFYKNGNKKVKGNYVSGNRMGIWLYWYENGIKEGERKFLPKHVWGGRPEIISYWDSTGNQKVINGEGDYSFSEEITIADSAETITFSGKVKNNKLDGVWKGIFPDGTLSCEETYDTGKFVSGYCLDGEGKKHTYDKLDEMPEFPGGNEALIKFLQRNVHYPKVELDNDIQGKVIVKFVVDRSGNVTDVAVVRSVSRGLDKEALRVVNSMPKWVPGKQHGRPVKVLYQLPVAFRLQ